MKIIKNKHQFFQFDEIPSDDDLINYYRDKYYQNNSGSYEETYDAEEIKYFYNKIDLKSYFIEKQFKESNEVYKILDIGCGEGFTLDYFQKKGWDVFGIDYSDFGIKKFNPHLLDKYKNVSFNQYFSESVQNNIKYDVVWLKHVLEHVPDPMSLICSIFNILKTNGILCLEVPNDFSIIQNVFLKTK